MPLMVLLAFLILIILVLLARASSPRKSGAGDADMPQVVDEIEPEVLPPQEIIEPEIRPKVEEEVLQPREIIEPEIRPIVEEGESVADFQPPPNEAEIKDDIRPLLQKGASDGCQYCSIFRDIGTAVCPNCGRPLNLKIIQKES